MRIPTQNQWKFEGLAESLAQVVGQEHGFSQDAIKEMLLNAFDKVYELGKADPEHAHQQLHEGVKMGLALAKSAISVTDLTSLPELFEHAKWRWQKGICQ